MNQARKQGGWSAGGLLLALGLPACGAAPPAAPAEAPAEPPPAEDIQLCRGLGEQRGVTLCRGPVDEATARHLEVSYRLHRKKGLPWRIEHVNGWGRLVENEDGMASTEVAYGTDPPVEETARDAKGRLLFRIRYSQRLVRTDLTSAEGRPAVLLNGRTYPTDLRVFDARGLVKQTRYFDALGNPTFDQEDKAFGHRVTRNERGFPIALEALDASARTLVSLSACSLWKWDVDELGLAASKSCFTGDGVPALAPGAYHALEYQLDRWGNRTRTRLVDLEGRPTRSRGGGFAGIKRTLGDHGEELEIVYLGETGQPVDAKKGFATQRTRYDERGRPVEIRYFSADGSPAHVPHEAWGRRLGYDEHDRPTEVTFLDGEGHPIADGRPATLRQTWSDDGHVGQQDYFDAEGKPAAAPADEAACGVCEQPITTEVYQSILGSITAAQNCTESVAVGKTSAATTSVRVRVGKDGAACSVDFLQDTSEYPELAACIQKRFEKARYRAPVSACASVVAEIKLQRAK